MRRVSQSDMIRCSICTTSGLPSILRGCSVYLAARACILGSDSHCSCSSVVVVRRGSSRCDHLGATNFNPFKVPDISTFTNGATEKRPFLHDFRQSAVIDDLQSRMTGKRTRGEFLSLENCDNVSVYQTCMFGLHLMILVSLLNQSYSILPVRVLHKFLWLETSHHNLYYKARLCHHGESNLDSSCACCAIA